MLFDIRLACLIKEFAFCVIGAYKELMISAWISAMGAERTKCSERSLLIDLLRDGRGVFASDGAMANGRPSRIDVPRSCNRTIPQRLMRRRHSSSEKIEPWEVGS